MTVHLTKQIVKDHIVFLLMALFGDYSLLTVCYRDLVFT